MGFFYEWPSPALVAAAQKLYEVEMGVPVNWIAYETSYDMNRGLGNGEIQIAFSHELIPFMEGVGAGLNAVITGIAVNYPDYDLCILSKESNIFPLSPENLKGKTVATIKGTVSHLRTLATLDILGVDEADVIFDFKNHGADIAKSMYMNSADIGCAFGGPLITMKTRGAPIVKGEVLDKKNLKLFDLITMSGGFVDKHRPLAEKFMKVVDSVNQNYLSNPVSMRKAMARTSGLSIVSSYKLLKMLDFLTVSQQLSRQWLGKQGGVEKYMSLLAEFLDNHGKISNPVDNYSSYIDTRLLIQQN